MLYSNWTYYYLACLVFTTVRKLAVNHMDKCIKSVKPSNRTIHKNRLYVILHTHEIPVGLCASS